MKHFWNSVSGDITQAYLTTDIHKRQNLIADAMAKFFDHCAAPKARPGQCYIKHERNEQGKSILGILDCSDEEARDLIGQEIPMGMKTLIRSTRIPGAGMLKDHIRHESI